MIEKFKNYINLKKSNMEISIKDLVTYIKPLEWVSKNDYICAEPDGLRWKYYITSIEDKFELALIDDCCDWNRKSHKFYNDLYKAKQVAEKHYLKVIKSFLHKRSI